MVYFSTPSFCLWAQGLVLARWNLLQEDGDIKFVFKKKARSIDEKADFSRRTTRLDKVPMSSSVE